MLTDNFSLLYDSIFSKHGASTFQKRVTLSCIHYWLFILSKCWKKADLHLHCWKKFQWLALDPSNSSLTPTNALVVITFSCTELRAFTFRCALFHLESSGTSFVLSFTQSFLSFQSLSFLSPTSPPLIPFSDRTKISALYINHGVMIFPSRCLWMPIFKQQSDLFSFL